MPSSSAMRSTASSSSPSSTGRRGSRNGTARFFMFFLFVVLAAAYRWGFRETILTTSTIVGLFLVETSIAGAWNREWFPWTDLSLNRSILRVTYLSLTGFLVGYLAEQEK